MKTNRKGFTITELVIVIVVIAILAAVLIPTFSSLIKKANVSADTQLAKNLNTALTMAEASGEKIETFSDALDAMQDNGYVVANLNPTADGHYFVWESESNQILLVDGEKNFEIVYKSKDLAKATPGATWWFAVSDPTLVDGLKDATGSDDINVFYTPKTVEELNKVFEDVYNNGGEQSVVISEDLTLSNNQFMLNHADGKVTFDLIGNTVTNTSGITYNVEGTGDKTFSQLTAQKGTLTVANGYVVSDSNSFFAISAIESGNVNVDNVVIENVAKSGLALRVLGSNANMNVKDTTINVQKAGGIEVGIGTATFDNVTIKSTDAPIGDKAFSAVCVSASRGGTLTINSGSYNAEGTAKGVVAFYTTCGTININGGTFTSNNTNKNIFYAYPPSNDAYGDTHTITISGGTFNGKEFSSFTSADEWKALFVFESNAGNGFNAVKDNGVWIITIEN